MKIKANVMNLHEQVLDCSPGRFLHDNDAVHNQSWRANKVGQKAILWMTNPLGSGAVPEDYMGKLRRNAQRFERYAQRRLAGPALGEHPCKKHPSAINVAKAAGAGGLVGVMVALPVAVPLGLLSGAVQTLWYGSLSAGVLAGISTGVACTLCVAGFLAVVAAVCAIGVWVGRAQGSPGGRDLSRCFEEVSGCMALVPRVASNLLGVYAAERQAVHSDDVGA